MMNYKALINFMDKFDFVFIKEDKGRDRETKHIRYYYMYFENEEYGKIRVGYDKFDKSYGLIVKSKKSTEWEAIGGNSYNIPQFKFNFSYNMHLEAFCNKSTNLVNKLKAYKNR